MTERALTQTYQPNPLLSYVYHRFFEHIQVDEGWVRTVRDAAARGSVVYTLRNLSFLDFLALDHLTKRYGLPQIRFANDLGLWILEPMGKGWLDALFPHGQATVSEQLAHAIDSGGSAALFLKRPPNLLEFAGGRTGHRHAMSEGDELLRALVGLQRTRERPILFVPQVFVWTKRPDTRGGFGLLDTVLGPREWPGKLRTTMQFLANYRNVVMRAGEPLDLREHLEAAAGETNGATHDDALVRRLTYALLRKVERERSAVLGPAKKPNDRVRDEVVRSPKLQALIRDMAGEGEKERLVLTVRAHAMLRQMQAQPEPDVIRGFDLVLDHVVHRIYDGMEVDQEGLERVREAAKRGTLVLLPSHKSHVDYLILSYVFEHANLQLPVIAAGDNLSFFPLGPMFRRGGAFFIRRSFKGDKLYAAVVDAYIRRLLRDGYAIEFFLEGGRSRTGKLLPPKLGLLNMVVDAALTLPGKEVFFVPVSIGYERVVEGGSYVRELSGGEKQKEDAKGLLKTTDVLRGRYGRLNIQFGPPIALDEARDSVGIAKDDAAITPAKRRALVTRLAHRVMAEINAATAVTPGSLVALALLSTPRRGLSQGELVEACRRYAKVLRRMGARISKSLVTPSGELREEAIREAAQLFVEAETVTATVPGQGASTPVRKRARIYTGPDVIYAVPDEKRMSLDLSKNVIVHYFVPRALVSAALLVPSQGGQEGHAIGLATLEDRVRKLSRLFKYEFMFRANQSFEENFAETVADMTADGELSSMGGGITFGAGHDGLDGREWVRTYASIVRTYLEGYRVAARGLAALVKGAMPQKELVKRTIVAGERMFLSGELQRREAVSRPLIENALAAFTDQGYVSVGDGKISLAESFATASAVRAIEGRIAGYWTAEGIHL